MILFDENIILDMFAGLPFAVRGIGIFRESNGVTLVCKRDDTEYIPIGLNGALNGGYLRYNGEAQFTSGENISASEKMYRGKIEIHLVTGTYGINTNSLMHSLLYRLGQIEEVTIKKSSENKQQILAEERMEMNTLDMLKVVFDYEFDFINPGCDVDLICNC